MAEATWQKSSFSTDGNECIELARSAGSLLIRESDLPDAALTTSAHVLRLPLSTGKAGGLDRRG
ncbi:DUF397 domain-containing protein [Streptomyces sp. ISL-11]|uniref:DUF397 domain-containing protein n=1 Tax=Streptomyces sp. ISL-11 TaxID=2819174 RepID=UPI001BE65832|nr:DUF397 domain-containing protein [Streptomyces sp. ISL-11]MBT2382041.1 DUF397 domain-containing protein [Streptomyces sp. ISL-11]